MHEDGAGLSPDDEVSTSDGFAVFVNRLQREGNVQLPPPPGRVHCSYWWIVDDAAVLGAIALRHELNDFLLRAGGHIGYGVRPSARGRGVATWAVLEVLERARVHGLDRVLVTCAEDNAASAGVIERCGGRLEDVRNSELGEVRRYWIDLATEATTMAW